MEHDCGSLSRFFLCLFKFLINRHSSFTEKMCAHGYKNTHLHTDTHTGELIGRCTDCAVLQLHPSPLSPPLHFTTFHPSIIPSCSSLIVLHPLYCPSHLLPLPLSCLSLPSFMISFPLTFKPTFAFEHQPPSIFTSASLPIFSTYLEFASVCPSPSFSLFYY